MIRTDAILLISLCAVGLFLAFTVSVGEPTRGEPVEFYLGWEVYSKEVWTSPEPKHVMVTVTFTSAQADWATDETPQRMDVSTENSNKMNMHEGDKCVIDDPSTKNLIIHQWPGYDHGNGEYWGVYGTYEFQVLEDASDGGGSSGAIGAVIILVIILAIIGGVVVLRRRKARASAPVAGSPPMIGAPGPAPPMAWYQTAQPMRTSPGPAPPMAGYQTAQPMRTSPGPAPPMAWYQTAQPMATSPGPAPPMAGYQTTTHMTAVPGQGVSTSPIPVSGPPSGACPGCHSIIATADTFCGVCGTRLR